MKKLLGELAAVLQEDYHRFLADNAHSVEVGQGLPEHIRYWCDMAGLRTCPISVMGVSSYWFPVMRCVGGIGFDWKRVLRHNKYLFQLAQNFSQDVLRIEVIYGGRTLPLLQLLSEDASLRKRLSYQGGIRCLTEHDPKHWGPCSISGDWYFDPGNVVYAFVLHMVVKFSSDRVVWSWYLGDTNDEEKLGDYCEALLGLCYLDQRNHCYGVYDLACATLEELVRAAEQMLIDCGLWDGMYRGQSKVVLEKYSELLDGPAS